jgi:dolichyl-diphosphooligosaccharide--protein glycosyltransferase
VKASKKSRWSLNSLVIIVIVVLLFGIALSLRVIPPYNGVFTTNWIKFTGNDAYYHMRLVDNLVNNFPQVTDVDPYFIYPGATGQMKLLFFHWLLGIITWIIGLGSPSEHLIEVVGAYYPAFLGALTVIPVYFIGKELFGRWAGVLSAALLAILPGEFLGRSILGFTDQHVAETLFSTVTMLFLILAIKAAIRNGLSFGHLRRWEWAVLVKPAIYSSLSGIFLGLYILTWQGALLFVFTISIYFIIQSIIDHLKKKSTDYLAIVGVILFLVTLVVSLWNFPSSLFLPSLIIAFLIPLVLGGVSRLMTSRKMKLYFYPLSLIGIGAAGLVLFYVIKPTLFNSMVAAFNIFNPSAILRTTIEAQSLLFTNGNFSLYYAWGNFTTSFYLIFISLAILIYLLIKHGDADKGLLVVWSLVILVATLSQRRFAYYLVVNVALLSGYLSWRFLELLGLRESITKVAKTAKEVTARRARQRARSVQTTNWAAVVLAVVVIFFVAFFWNIQIAITTAGQTSYAPSDAWCSSLTWMRDNTPEPFGNPDAYYQLFNLPPPGESFRYPESAYGVAAWWDYGYWITGIAHRIPVANPSQERRAVRKVASFFIAQDEATASTIAEEMGSAYVIIDYQIAYFDRETGYSKFPAIVTWANEDSTDFFDLYFVQQEGKMTPVYLLHPAYYQSLAIRLYNFDGEAFTPENVLVITYEEREDQSGIVYKEITNAEQFGTYGEAQTYIASQPSGNNKYRIVGTDPFQSPVPLEAMSHYKPIYSSDNITLSGGVSKPEIKIFEFVK